MPLPSNMRGFLFAYPPPQSREAVHDDQDELVLLEAGEYEFILDKESFLQKSGVEVLIPAEARHTIKNIGPNDSTIYYDYKSKSF